MEESVKIEIKNCNNIDTGSINIIESKLNIKFGINGTGKSTIVKAIQYKIESPDNLVKLKPFKARNTELENNPEVIIPEKIKSVFIFNEEYVNQFVYKEDELVSNSFEIFIKSPNYIKTVQEIESILENIKKVFQEDESLIKIINDFDNLAKSFTLTSTGKLSKTSPALRALENGNQIEHIPTELQGYSPFIKNKSICTNWLGWQMKGRDFVDISDNCPFCTSSTQGKKEMIKSVSTIYQKNIIEKLVIIIDAVNSLGNYFSPKAKQKIIDITTKNIGLEEDETNYLSETKKQIDIFLAKLKSFQLITPKDLAENDKVEEQIKSLEIKFDYLDRFDSKSSKEIANSLNSSLSEVLKQITDLKRALGQQKGEIKKLIKDHQDNINDFLKNAGYKYQVIITEENKDYKLRLKHTESKEQISKGSQYLSFGERNAFALVLFMYEALSKKSDLIILDDPVSSFDKNKKYAIMDMLFREDYSFKGKTVLMLTHDLEPIIDVVKVLHNKFGNLAKCSFLNVKENKIQELEITKNDLLSFSKICNQVINFSTVDNIVKVIYLRRYYESVDDKGDEYEVLSNLLHKRTKLDATDQRKEKVDDKYQSLLESDFDNGVENIKSKYPNFDFEYDSLLRIIQQDEKIIEIYNNTKDSFAKIILFRILIDEIEESKKPSDVFMKFINEIYHIENDFLFQLNPEKFDIAPQFIIEGCDNFVKSLDSKNRL